MKKYLFVVLLIAIYFRFSGITHGYPPYHADEGMSYSQGIQIVLEKTLDAHGYSLHYAYPGLIPIINALIFKKVFLPIAWLKWYAGNIGNFADGLITFPLTVLDHKRILANEILGVREVNVLIWGRILSAVVGVGNVYLTYVLSKKLFSSKVGIIAALFVSVNYRQVLNSHFALPDIYNAFFLLISIVTSWNLYIHRRSRDYIMAGIAAGLFVSTKFHIYSLIPLVTALLYIHVDNGFSLKKIITDTKGIVTGLIVLGVVIILNPYHFIHWEETVAQLADVSRKYGVGVNKLNIYSFSYLYHFGIGKVTSILTLIGIIVPRKRFRQWLFLMLPTLLFFFVITYYTGGGFYTRNFVTIIPVLLIFAAQGVVFLYDLVTDLFDRNRSISSKSHHNILHTASKDSNILLKSTRFVLVSSVVLLFSFSIYENSYKSYVVAQEYRKEWNYKIVERWIVENIEDGSTVSAHSSVPLSNSTLKRSRFEVSSSASIEEFKENDADYGVLNLNWMTNDYYGWMNQYSLENWNKPVQEMEETYPALSIREFQDYAIFSVINSEFAPDSNFIVAKIPQYKQSSEVLSYQYDVDENIRQSFRGFSSEVIDVSHWQGIKVDFEGRVSPRKDGFLFVEYFASKEDAEKLIHRKAVRLSRRVSSDSWEYISMTHDIPVGSNYARVSSGIYNKSVSKFNLRNIRIYNTNVETDFGKWKAEHVDIPEGEIFPNSHGNL